MKNLSRGEQRDFAVVLNWTKMFTILDLALDYCYVLPMYTKQGQLEIMDPFGYNQKTQTKLTKCYLV